MECIWPIESAGAAMPMPNKSVERDALKGARERQALGDYYDDH